MRAGAIQGAPTAGARVGLHRDVEVHGNQEGVLVRNLALTNRRNVERRLVGSQLLSQPGRAE